MQPYFDLTRRNMKWDLNQKIAASKGLESSNCLSKLQQISFNTSSLYPLLYQKETNIIPSQKISSVDTFIFGFALRQYGHYNHCLNLFAIVQL
jgi:hypothetical protein